MRVLVTSARFPFAVAEVRSLGSAGHEVYAADTFWTSPGIHSRYVRRALRTAAPALEAAHFVSDIARIAREHRIELIVPASEEAFYLARHRDELPAGTDLFCPPFETLARVHNKQTFAELAASLGLAVPRTVVARSPAELLAAAREFDRYMARPVYSRGGTEMVANTGPLAGQRDLAACKPTAERPWIVQEYVQGEDVCTFSIAQHGRVAAHCAYVHPLQIEHAGGISFRSVDASESLPVAERLVAALGYHGQVSFDFLRSRTGRLVLIECNPRPTAGACLMPAADLAAAITRPLRNGRPTLVPPGLREQIAVAVLRDMLQDPHAIRADVAALATGGEDVYLQARDPLPGLFQLLSYTQLMAYRRHVGRRARRPTDLVDAQFYDIAWNGERER